jgi:HlyD family secretion protein
MPRDEPGWLTAGLYLKLTPGMPVEAFIEAGERTMLSYLVKPLHDQLMRAIREK